MNSGGALTGTVSELGKTFAGQLLQPADPGYDDARKVHNGLIDKRPALIARYRCVADIVDAVKLAREQKLEVAVRGGGHNIAGHSLCDGGLVLDLSLLNRIRVDPAARTVRAEGGVTWGELDFETQAFGLATTGGFISTTGIAGLTLGGGFGWLMHPPPTKSPQEEGLAIIRLRFQPRYQTKVGGKGARFTQIALRQRFNDKRPLGNVVP